jgi:hypothetical protein
MSAATLLVARSFMPQLKKKVVREYLLLAQAQDWDRSYGPEDDVQCPLVPLPIRHEYAKLYHYQMKQGVNNKFLTHEFMINKKDTLVPLALGGQGGSFTSALMWAGFGNTHAHQSSSSIQSPDEEDTITFIHPSDPNFNTTGRILKNDFKTGELHIRVNNNVIKYKGPTNSLLVNGRGTYPIQLPPHTMDIPPEVNTIVHDTHFSFGIRILLLEKQLESIVILGRQLGYNVKGMILGFRGERTRSGHAVAAFPCPSFPNGWMFCNTWKGDFGGCVSLAELEDELKEELGDVRIEQISILYARRQTGKKRSSSRRRRRR